MDRRNKGDKRSSRGGQSVDPRYGEVSAERMEELLKANARETRLDPIETSAYEATTMIEDEVADFKDTPSEIKTAATPAESAVLRDISSSAENVAIEASTAIENTKNQWGRSAKKVTSEIVFSGAPAEEKSRVIYSEIPEIKSNRAERLEKSEKPKTPEPIIQAESNPLHTAEMVAPKPEPISVETPKPTLAIAETISEEVVPILEAKQEQIANQKFNEFFTNLSFDDLKDIKKLKEKFAQMITDETMLMEMGVDTLYAEEFKNRYFENFCQQAEVVMQDQIRQASASKENNTSKTDKLKAEGSQLLKGVWGGGSYALANRAVMTGLKFVSAPALALKLAGGGLTGAAVSGFNYLTSRGFEKLNAQSLKKLATQAEKMSKDGLDTNGLFEQLKNDMDALLKFEKQRQESMGTQKNLAYRLRFDDEKIENIFSGENSDEKRAKIDHICSLLVLTENTKKNSDQKYQAEDIKDRQELIKSLTANNALEEYAAYQIEEALKQLKGASDLSEADINKLAIQAELMVSREMNVILGDVVAQEKFAEIDNKGKSAYEKSYVAKLFGKNPPDSLMQALGKGFVSGSIAGAAYSDAIAGAVYMGMQRIQGSLRNEILKQSASEVKTTKDILSDFNNFALTNENIDQARGLISEARARIKLPDIKEAERAKIELQIQNLQNKMISEAKNITAEKNETVDTKKMAKSIVSQREKEIAQAADIATKERARKSFRGLWKTFAQLSNKEKFRTLGRAGLEGTKGAIAGAIGGELVNASSTALSGEDYNINQGLDNIYNRVILNTADTITSKDNTEIPNGDTANIEEKAEVPVDTTKAPALENSDSTLSEQKGILEQMQEVLAKQKQAANSGFKYSLQDDFDIEEMAVDTKDFIGPQKQDSLFPDTLANDSSLVEQKTQINEIAQALQSGDTIKADTLIKDSTLDSTTVDSLKNLVAVNEKLGINTFENGLKAEDLDKIICELDNDPKSPEAQTAKQALQHLLKNGSLSLEQYQETIKQHLGQELQLGNVELAKNAIGNSGIDIKTINEAVGRVELEKNLGINAFDGGLDETELKIISDQIHGGEKSQAAQALLEQLHKDGLITDQQKFSIEHPTVVKAGFKEEAGDEKDVKYKLSLELGKDAAPKHLEQVFYRLGIDNIDLDKGEVTNVEAARILNIGANLRVLSEGHDIAGITGEEFQKYVNIEGNKITITDYEGFQENVIAKLADHATEIIMAENVANTGAVAYIDNIKNETWGDMLSAEGVKDENIKFDQEQIQKAEGRVFQDNLEKSNLGELATEVNFSDEESGSFTLENQTITVENNQVVKIGDNILEEPLYLQDKESGEKLIDKVSETKATEFLSLVEKNQEAMMARLNEQLDNQSLQKIEIPESLLPKPEYDISTELNTALNKLGFDDAESRKEWNDLKKESLSELLHGKTEETIEDKDDAIKMHTREHMREFLEQAVRNDEIKVDDGMTVERAMKDLMVKETREKLMYDIAVAEQKVKSVQELEQIGKKGSETLRDQLKEGAESQKETISKQSDMSAGKLYENFLDEKLPTEEQLDKMSVDDLEKIKGRLEIFNYILKQNPPDDVEVADLDKAKKVIGENEAILEKINKRLDNTK